MEFMAIIPSRYASTRFPGKPLIDLAGKPMIQRVYEQVKTAVSVRWHGQERHAVETTVVEFRPLTDAEIAAYVATGEPMDKAGAYGIQGKGAILVSRIAGSYDNVVGLPRTLVYTILQGLGAL